LLAATRLNKVIGAVDPSLKRQRRSLNTEGAARMTEGHYEWRRVFALTPRKMSDGHWAWLCWIEVARSYYHSLREVRRWPKATVR
jgi:hypothetical protein